MSLRDAFEKASARGEAAFIPYLTAGYPDDDTFIRLCVVLDQAGADVIEIGLPFSDPVADGPVIQASSQKALENGVTPDRVLDLTAKVRALVKAELVIMTYFNPIFRMGPDRFAARAAQAGVVGVIVPDLPIEEAAEFGLPAQNAGLDHILMAAPTTSPERLARIAQKSRGFLYYVSMTGVTGAGLTASKGLLDQVRRARSVSPAPVAVGFGVADPQMANALAREADGVIVGSALIKTVMNAAGSDAQVAAVRDLAQSLKAALKAPRPSGTLAQAAA